MFSLRCPRSRVVFRACLMMAPPARALYAVGAVGAGGAGAAARVGVHALLVDLLSCPRLPTW